MALAGKIKAGAAYVEISTENTKLLRGLRAAQMSIRQFGVSVQAVGGDLLRLTGMLSVPLALSVKTFASFDDQMRAVQAITQATDAELAKLTSTAEELGATTAFTATQVAEGMVSLSRMGFTATQVNASIAPILKLVRATGTDMFRLGEVAKYAAAAMRDFKIPAEDMADVCNVLTYASNSSAMEIFDLGEAIKIIGPTAYPVGDSLRDVAANLMTLANAGIKGSLAGTALRKVYQALAKQTGEEATQLREMGISLKDINGNMRRPMDILRDLSKVVQQMKSGEKINFSVDVFDLRGSLGALPLLAATEETKAFRDALDDVSGLADKTAAKMEGGIGGALRMMISRFQALQITIGRAIDESFRPAIVAFTAMLDATRKWVQEHKSMVAMIAAVIAGAAVLGVTLITLGLTMKVIAGAIGGLIILLKALVFPFVAVKAVVLGIIPAIKACGAAIMTFVLSDIGAFVAGLGALVGVLILIQHFTGAFTGLIAGLRGIGSDFAKAFTDIKEIWGETWGVIKTALSAGDLAGAAKVGLAALKVSWLTGIFPLKKAWIELKNFLADSWAITVYSILKLGTDLWYGLLIGLKTIGNAIADAWGVIWNGIINVFEKTVLELQKAWIRTKGFFDSQADVDAEISVVEWVAAERRAERERNFADAVNRRAGEPAELERERVAAAQNIDDALNREISDNQKKYDQAILDAASEIEVAKDAWRDAIHELEIQTAEGAEEIARQKEAVREGAAETFGAATSMEGKTFGSFSAAAIGAMIGGTAAERTAKATEESVKQQRETNRHLRRMENTSAVYA